MSGPSEDNRFMISVLVPVFNEARTIQQIVKAVLSVPFPIEIIVVDDGSTDGTMEILENIRHRAVKVFQHDGNRGKGAALRTGLAHAKGDIILIQDADLEYDPEDYTGLLKPIIDGKADVVYGSRFAVHGKSAFPYYRQYVGNRLFTALSNILSNTNLTDIATCYKVFSRHALADICIEQDGFGFDPEITAKLARKRLKIYEVPISYNGRTYEEGKKIGWKDSANYLWCIIKYNLFGS